MTEIVNAVGKLLQRSGPTTANVFPEAGSAIVEGSDLAEAVWDGEGAILTLAGGAGDDTYRVWNFGRTVVEEPDEGVDTISTWMSTTLPANVENLIVTGDERHAFGNDLDNIVSGASGFQTIDGRGGNDVLEGGGDPDNFIVSRGNGSDVILDFEPGAGGDVVRLDYPSLGDFAAVKASIVQRGDDAVLPLAPGEELVFRGISRDALVFENFQLPIDLSGRDLLFEDEFDGDAITTAFADRWKSTFYYGDRVIGSNGELQYYVDALNDPSGVEAHRLGGGTLDLVAEPMPDALNPDLPGEYTSGLISSEPSFSMQYGYVEMRAKLPEGKGLWPVFWLLPLDGSWPPELDVMEALGDRPRTLYTTVHTNENGRHEKVSKPVPVPDMFDDFHTFGVDWQPDTVTWYFDGIAVFRAPTPSDMQEPMYILANLAVGGTWPGSPDATTPFPATMTIDYIRAWSAQADGAPAPVPAGWAPIDPSSAFSDISMTDMPRTWQYRTEMAPGAVGLKLEGDWARYAFGNAADNLIVGSDAPYAEIDGGGGDDVLVGNGGTDVFVLRDGDGNDRIRDFANVAGDTDKVRLEGFHFTHFEDVRPFLSETPDGAMLRLDEDQAVLFDGVAVDALEPEQFIFVDPEDPPADAAPATSAPDAIPGLNLWLDSSAEATGPAGRLTDRSGRGTDAVASGEAAAGLVTEEGLVLDGDDVYVLADTEGLNLGGPFAGKTLTFAIRAGSDVTSRQVLFEQGGGQRGLSVIVEDGEVVMSAWNRSEEVWGPTSVSAAISPGEASVLSLVFDGAAGSLTAVKDGVAVDGAGGIGLLHAHGNDIGLGGVAQKALTGTGTVLEGGNFYRGTLQEVVGHDRALGADDLSRLHGHLAEKWTPGEDGGSDAEKEPAGSSAPDEVDGLVLWFDAQALDAGPAARLVDLTGRGNDGRQDFAESQASVDGGVLLFDGDDVYAIADTEDINTRPVYEGRSVTIALALGENVTGRQVVYEQGGGTRGLSVVVENGEIVLTGWNLKETAWGPASVRTKVSPGEVLVVSLVLDGVSGTLTGFKNGEAFGSAGGLGLLYGHGADIGLGQVVKGGLAADGDDLTEADAYEGGLMEFAYHDAALDAATIAALHDHLAANASEDAARLFA